VHIQRQDKSHKTNISSSIFRVKQPTPCSLVETITKVSEESAASIFRVGPKNVEASFLLSVITYPPDKVVPLRDKEAYRGSRGVVPLILKLRIRWT
jgi:hypothetical protein